MEKKMKKGLMALLCAGTIALTGCYGSYGSTKWLHNAIGSIDNKWVKSLVHFLATPVYGVTFFFVDFLFINTYEFWTGTNPFASGDSYYEEDANGNSVAAVKNEDGSLSVQFTSAKGEVSNLTLQRDENVVRALDASGELVAQYEIEK